MITTESFEHICRYIEEHRDDSLPLETLANMVGLSPSHFQRRFKAAIGISAREYLEACRLGKLKEVLRNGVPISDAIYEAGFNSGSRVYEKIDTRLGMTPKQYRSGGKNIAISYATCESSLGNLMMAATDRGLCFIQFGKTTDELLHALKTEFPNAEMTPMNESQNTLFTAWMQALEKYLTGEKPDLNLPLDIQGTAFQRKVWDYLQKIPYGSVQSYTEVAEGIGQPKAARAVASACAANNLAIAIPCHRVIRGDGSLGGYRWGLAVKRTLIDQERGLV